MSTGVRSSRAEVDYGPSARAVAAEARAWLEEHAHEATSHVETRGVAPKGAWTQRLREARWLCLGWPPEVGGRGLSGLEAAAVDAEFTRAGVARPTLGMGESLVGPAIIVHGTEEQKAHFLPRILDGTDRYCQGFSEPDAGSDLANVQTRGVVDGDEVVITGQKVWTSWYWDATMIFTLCRTNPDAAKHDGISYVLVPLDRGDDGRPRNGIELRPLRQIGGEAHFAETFLDGARAPLFNVIGGLDNGWRVSKTTLGNERGGSAATQHVRFEIMVRKLIEEARRRGRAGDPVLRQRLATMHTRVQLIRYGGLRTLASLIDTGDPGPAASTNKMLWSELHRDLAELALEVLGADATVVGEGYKLDRWQADFFGSRASTIWGGTAEIQRNIVGERVLGLPREPGLS
ncbi:MAG TPA: acyl-CoA dehydrogenase family protein [Acidimicrobiales bacterium]|nr:acyl-CoA dehydrogenase family protein [Acidimicrobiales bacterium]